MIECQLRLLIAFVMFLIGAVEVNTWLIIPAIVTLMTSIGIGYDKKSNW